MKNLALCILATFVGLAFTLSAHATTYKRGNSVGTKCMDSHTPNVISETESETLIQSVQKNTPWLQGMAVSKLPTGNGSSFIARNGYETSAYPIEITYLSADVLKLSFAVVAVDAYGRIATNIRDLCSVEYSLVSENNQTTNGPVGTKSATEQWINLMSTPSMGWHQYNY